MIPNHCCTLNIGPHCDALLRACTAVMQTKQHASRSDRGHTHKRQLLRAAVTDSCCNVMLTRCCRQLCNGMLAPYVSTHTQTRAHRQRDGQHLILLFPETGLGWGLKVQVVQKQVCSLLLAHCNTLFLQQPTSLALKIAKCQELPPKRLLPAFRNASSAVQLTE